MHYKINYISISFHIEWDMIVVTVFLSILIQMEFNLVKNQMDNCFDCEYMTVDFYLLFYIRQFGDSFLFDFERNGIPFGSNSKGKLWPRSCPIQCDRKWKYSFLSPWGLDGAPINHEERLQCLSSIHLFSAYKFQYGAKYIHIYQISRLYKLTLIVFCEWVTKWSQYSPNLDWAKFYIGCTRGIMGAS